MTLCTHDSLYNYTLTIHFWARHDLVSWYKIHWFTPSSHSLRRESHNFRHILMLHVSLWIIYICHICLSLINVQKYKKWKKSVSIGDDDRKWIANDYGCLALLDISRKNLSIRDDDTTTITETCIHRTHAHAFLHSSFKYIFIFYIHNKSQIHIQHSNLCINPRLSKRGLDYYLFICHARNKFVRNFKINHIAAHVRWRCINHRVEKYVDYD